MVNWAATSQGFALGFHRSCLRPDNGPDSRLRHVWYSPLVTLPITGCDQLASAKTTETGDLTLRTVPVGESIPFFESILKTTTVSEFWLAAKR